MPLTAAHLLLLSMWVDPESQDFVRWPPSAAMKESDVTIAAIKSPLMMLWLTQRLSEKVFDGVL